ncbi:glycosyltransferase family 4 protein [Caldimonas thermodepolymerans]|uniref:glycosyltransferase family 4 protein n=1 Tax=Caldimonas thermodepolymerans TaxID=215580 RepID=UPI002236BCD7|nr:glycosyltransferase family 1 protein [Caldimonas thermodepolymerans]UZG45417.1 glycosyltransferase family 1 protein [Caldimonas thermodepolymerans]
MKMALISEHASPLATLGGVDAGGQNIYVMHMAQCLARAGHEVDVYTRRDDPALPTVVHLRPGLRVIHVDTGPACFVPKEQLLPHMQEFAQACETRCRHAGGYDVVHANFFMSGCVALHLKRTFGTPFAITFHALGLVRREHQRAADGFPDERIGIERELVAQADCVVAECPQDRLDLIRLYGADPRRMVTVPCGFDPAEFGPMDRTAVRRELGLDPDEFIVLQLGRLVPRKGIDNVIRAMAYLGEGMPSRLLVVGGESDTPDERVTPEIARLRDVAREAGVDGRVVFTGRRQRERLRLYYGAADVFVTTPWYEPFGITPLEAMACGRPVVGSAVGGIQHTVMHGVTGFLVPPHDPVALGRRLAALRDNPALARALGRAGIRRARSLFTWERVARQLAGALAVLRPSPVQHTADVVPLPRGRSAPLGLVHSATH